MEICKKFIDNDGKKVRDLCNVIGKFRVAAHGSCNINLQLTKKVPVIFHLILNELGKFDVKISVIPNGLEKCIAFLLNKNLVMFCNS